jgi:glycine/D-amino acid oxidase-like deaminating enzyme
VVYKDITAGQIVFSEGVQHLRNPLYQGDWLVPKKGEYVTFSAPGLKLDHMLKGPYFLVPLGDDHYQAGATFAHGDNSPDTTIEGRQKLREAISKMINCPFEIVGQTAGLRPTVKDRRPVLGSINGKKETLLLNGFGTRGILMAPLLSSWLIDHSESGTPLPAEVDIKRFWD